MKCVVGLDPSLRAFGMAVLRMEPSIARPRKLVDIGLHQAGDTDLWTATLKTYSKTSLQAIESQIGRVTSRIKVLQPEWVAIELPAYGKNLPGHHALAGLLYGVVIAVRECEVPVHGCAPASIKKFVAGKGSAEKSDVADAIRSTYPGFSGGPDASDAAAVIEFARAALESGKPVSGFSPNWKG